MSRHAARAAENYIWLIANGRWSNGLWMQAVMCDADFSVRLRREQRGALTELYKCRDDRWFMLALLNHRREG